mmetsp:Transcript_5149/g.15626  ORF Transcript_5149/g.15626 Transcript_5149/m.15626 type:complete len:111 (-) Transcript_5149:306-638(-)
MKARPAHYGLSAACDGRKLQDAALEVLLRDRLVMANVRTLERHSLVVTDEDGYALRPTEPGRLMAHYCINLKVCGGAAPRNRPQLHVLGFAMRRGSMPHLRTMLWPRCRP